MKPSRRYPVALLALVVAACSFTAIKRVPSDFKPGQDLDCTKGLAYPLIDMAGAVLSGVLAVSLISSEGTALKSGAIATGLASLGFGGSAVYGTYQVNRCRNTRQREGLNETAPVPLSNQPSPGSLGGTCLPDGSCEGELICDPMQTCVPLNETEVDL